MQQGVTLWLTGLVGSGRSTLARALAEALLARGDQIEVLSGARLRAELSPSLGYARADRALHLRQVAYIARLLSRNGVITVVDVCAPYREPRQQARLELGELVEVYVATPLEVCQRWDTRGLYARAFAGTLEELPGVSAPFESPEFPELVVNPAEESTRDSVARILALLEDLQYLTASSADQPRSTADDDKVRRRLEDLGYI